VEGELNREGGGWWGEDVEGGGGGGELKKRMRSVCEAGGRFRAG